MTAGHVGLLGEGGPGPEVVPPAPDVPVVVAQVPHGLAELGHVAAARTASRPAWVASAPNRSGRSIGVIIAPNPPLDLPMIARCAAPGQRAVPPVHPGHDLVAQVGVVPAGAGRVDELAAAVGGPRVDVDHDRWRGLPAGEHRVGGLGERLPVGRPVAPHRDVAGVALDHVDRRVGPRSGSSSYPGGRYTQQRPLVRVTERVPAQQLAGDRPARRSVRPGPRTRAAWGLLSDRAGGLPLPDPAPSGGGRKPAGWRARRIR